MIQIRIPTPVVMSERHWQARLYIDLFVLVKICGEIPEGFHGDWKLASTDKVVEFRKRYYRAYGAHGNDPFCKSKIGYANY